MECQYDTNRLSLISFVGILVIAGGDRGVCVRLRFASGRAMREILMWAEMAWISWGGLRYELSST